MQAIVEGTPVSPSFEDGYRIAVITDAILRSSEEERWVEVAAGDRAPA
jgi:predicted dehydrogenase